MIHSASKYISIHFLEHFFHILNNKDGLNGPKGIKKMEKIEPILKYQSLFYNIQSNNSVNPRGIKMRWKNKLFPSLNDINGKSSPYERKGALRYYQYSSEQKLGPSIVSIIIIPCSCHAFTKMLSLSLDSKIKETFNQPKYSILYNCNYSQIIGCRNNWIIMFLKRWNR